jgi:hypothetical protein
MSSVKLNCAFCNKLFDRPLRRYNKAMRKGQTNFFCSASCATSFQHGCNRKDIRDLSKGRICTGCKIYKERDQFYELDHCFNGLNPKCIECLSKITKSEKSKSNKRELYNSRKELGLCVKCGASELVNNCFCIDCWFQDKASMSGGGKENIISIRELFDKQQGKCFYSDEVLTPGVNASLDHQIPSSRDGKSEIDNLKWVSRQINMMKSDMTHEEFINNCAYIATKFELVIPIVDIKAPNSSEGFTRINHMKDGKTRSDNG